MQRLSQRASRKTESGCAGAAWAAELVEEAAEAVRGAAGECQPAPERLKKLLALTWAVAASRARRAWALAELSDGCAGSAVAGIDVRCTSTIIFLLFSSSFYPSLFFLRTSQERL